MPLHPLLEEWDGELTGGDPLGFPDYSPPERESVLTGRTAHYAFIEGQFDVLGGSMGAVHGERVVRAYRRATDAGLPVVVRSASGGARMQEGMVALVQMARTAGAARAHAKAGLLSVAVYGNPTTGGVFASYASLADIRAAEDGATIGFAGPRVVELTLGQRLPEHSHTARAAFAAALVDAVLEPDDIGSWIEGALGLASTPLLLPEPRRLQRDAGTATDGSAWEEVQLARAPGRPTGIDWAAELCTSWTELRGTDPVVRAGLATLHGRRAVVVAHDRYAATGRPRPAGFQLAQRAFALAARLRLPVVTFVDTPGADPGVDSEAEGVAGEIARTLAAMDELPGPCVAVCVGEGGSGGAMALAHADRLLIQEHAIFSVIGPEGAAAILHRDAVRAPEVAGRLRLTAADLLDLGVASGVVPETSAGALAVAVHDALDAAVVGDRRRRLDAATQRWVSP